MASKEDEESYSSSETSEEEEKKKGKSAKLVAYDAKKSKKKIKDLERAVEGKNNELQQFILQAKLNEYKLEQAEKERDKLKTDLDQERKEKNDEIKELKNKLENEKTARMELQTCNKIQENEKATLEKENTRLSEETRTLRTDLTAKTTLYQDVKEEKQKYELKLEETAKNLYTVTDERNELKEQVNRLSGVVESKTEEAHGKEVELRTKEEKLSHQEKDAEEKAKLLEKKEAEITRALEKYENDTKELQELHQKSKDLATSSSTSLQYEAELRKQYELKKEQLETERSQTMDKMQELQKERSSLQAKTEGLTELKEKSSEEEISLKKKLEKLQEERDTAVRERAEIQGQLFQKETEFKKAKEDFLTKIQKLEKEKDSLSKSCSVKDQRCKETQIISCSMSKEMREKVVDIVDQTIGQHEDELDIAINIKDKLSKCQSSTWSLFNSDHKSAWHCFVGREFASSLKAADGHYISLFKGNIEVTAFKTN